MLDAIVIGSGLFGQVIAKELRSLGLSTYIFDCGQKNPGSKPSASLMKPSWFNGMGATYTDPALELLDRHYGVQDLRFRVGPAKFDGVKWCDPRDIMGPGAELCKVTKVGRGYVETERRRFDARVIVVAAGVWTSHILPVPGLVGKMGAAVLHPNVQIQEPFIRPWAPYKQLVAFNLGDDMWVGDGSAIKPENWTPERQAKTVARCSVTGGLDIHGATVDTDVLEESKRVLVGTRPYVPKKHLNGRPCYLEEREPGLWVATGGAKNGTIAAGWCAHEIGKAVQ